VTSKVRFDDAFERAVEFAHAHRSKLGPTVIVRDLLGRFRFAFEEELDDTAALAAELHAQLGAFSPGQSQLFMSRSEMLAPDAIFSAPELHDLGGEVRLLERWVTGSDWLRPPLPQPSVKAERITFFGIKGGVGRSSAIAAVSRHLAEQGKRVVVFDLDLESPGVTASLLPSASRPTYGIVDWFVEDDVGQADENLLRDLVATSPLAAGTTGEIRVVPAGGTRGSESYTSKLARIYSSPPGRGDLAARLARLLEAVEHSERADYVLLDSRAGIHDLAAIAVTRLGATSLLFAIDTPQTWLAYGYLFATWQRDPARVRHFRDHLRIIAAQVPETGRELYLERLRDHASALFEEYLYDPADADDSDAFNFDVSDRDAPHSPVPIYWRRELQDWDPTREPATVTPEQASAAFGELLQYIDQWTAES